LARLNNAEDLAADLVASYEKYAHGSKAILFAVNIEHSRTIAQGFCLAGHAACHLDGETPTAERIEALRRFQAGEIKILTNCGLFDEGLDLPSIETVMCAKPTKSLSRWLQMCGRALRPQQGKEHALIIDHTDSWELHGLPCDERFWELDGVKRKNRKLVRKPNGEIVEEQEPLKQIEYAEVDLVEIAPIKESTKAIAVNPDYPPEDELYHRELRMILKTQQQRQLKPGWVYYKLVEMKPPLSVWVAAGMALGYKPVWAKIKFEEQIIAKLAPKTATAKPLLKIVDQN
jgi:superfamily II DNA or RNA helicase